MKVERGDRNVCSLAPYGLADRRKDIVQNNLPVCDVKTSYPCRFVEEEKPLTVTTPLLIYEGDRWDRQIFSLWLRIVLRQSPLISSKAYNVYWHRIILLILLYSIYL